MILQIWMSWIFLIFEDVDVLGEQLFILKLVLSLRQIIFCGNSVLCAKSHQSASIRTEIMSNLRKGFEEVGTNGNYDPLTLQGDPTTSHLIASYVTLNEHTKCCLEYYLKVLLQWRKPKR